MTWGSAKKTRKYREGVRIESIYEMIGALHSDHYVFVRGKAFHPAVLRNWSLASLEGACRYGNARIAELTPEWIDAEACKRLRAIENAAAMDVEFTEVGEKQ